MFVFYVLNTIFLNIPDKFVTVLLLEKTSDLLQVTDKLFHFLSFTTLVVICIYFVKLLIKSWKMFMLKFICLTHGSINFQWIFFKWHSFYFQWSIFLSDTVFIFSVVFFKWVFIFSGVFFLSDTVFIFSGVFF